MSQSFPKKLMKRFKYAIINGNDFFGHYLFLLIFFRSSFFSIKVITVQKMKFSIKDSGNCGIGHIC